MTTPHRITIGIDPGGRWAGLAAVRGRTFLAGAVVTRHRDNRTDDHEAGLEEWRAQVAQGIAAFTAGVLLADGQPVGADLEAAMLEGYLPAGVTLAAESVRKPNPHRRRDDGNSLTNVDGILATAAIVGALLERWPITLVSPGGHGSHPADAYPEAIRPVSAARKDQLRHTRSAFDVAVASHFLAAQRAADARRPVRPARLYTVRPDGTTATTALAVGPRC